MCGRGVETEESPEDEPDTAASAPDVEDGLPAEGVGHDTADGQADHGAHLGPCPNQGRHPALLLSRQPLGCHRVHGGECDALKSVRMLLTCMQQM